MREICGMETNIKNDNLEFQNAFKSENSDSRILLPGNNGDQQQAAQNLTDAVYALFEFLENEVEIESLAKRVTLKAFQTQIKHFLKETTKA